MSVFIVCKQAHQLISEGLDRPLSISERTQLKMHLAICRACTGFNGQMSFLRLAMKKTASEGLPQDTDGKDGGA